MTLDLRMKQCDHCLGSGSVPSTPGDDELFAAGIFRICETLRMANNGSGDPIHETTELRLIQYLAGRLKSWKPSTPSCAAYDAAVMSLIRATLDEIIEKRPSMAKKTFVSQKHTEASADESKIDPESPIDAAFPLVGSKWRKPFMRWELWIAEEVQPLVARGILLKSQESGRQSWFSLAELHRYFEPA